MSDFDDAGNTIGGTLLGIVTGVMLGVGFRVFVVEESSWSTGATALCGAAACGTLGMIFNAPLMRAVRAIVKFWFWWG